MSEEVKEETTEQTTEETVETPQEEAQEKQQPTGLQLKSLLAFKEGMGSYYDEDGDMFAVTVLRYEPWVVSQIKTQEKDGYEALQLSSTPKKDKRSNKAECTRLKAAGFEAGARFARELRGEIPEGAAVGQKVDIGSLEAGNTVKVSGITKGKGFAGVMRRYNFGGGRATHGSGFHRAPGSIGMCIWPGRVIAGRKMPGRMGGKQKTVKSQIVEVLPEDNVIIVKGAIPGGRHTLVELTRV